MRDSSFLRRLVVTVAVVFLVMVLVWLASKPIARFELGPGEVLRARPGVNLLLVGDGQGGWTRFDATARSAAHGVVLPASRGDPVLGPDGGAWLISDEGLLRFGAHGDPRVVLAADRLPDDALLVGVPGMGPPLLSVPDGDARVLAAPREDGSGLLELRTTDADGASAPLVVPPGAEVLCNPWSLSVAVPTDRGWTAWAPEDADDPTSPWHRALARDCTGDGAVFTPDGQGLIVPGVVDGLWLLDIRGGRLDFMADGNLGRSRRVPARVDFSRHPNPVLWCGQWTVDRVLHIVATHLGGGGRTQLKVSRVHDYNPALSWDGSLMVYCQAAFDEQGDEPFDEALYCLDRFQTDLPAVYVDDRQGGLPDQGPLFVGTSDAFVYVANGDVHGVVLQRPAIESPP